MRYWFSVWRAFYLRRKALRILGHAKFYLWSKPGSIDGADWQAIEIITAAQMAVYRDKP